MSDLGRLAADLEKEAVITTREVAGVVTKGAVNIKRDWRKRAQGIEHAPRYPISIGFDNVQRTPAGFEVAVGPEDSAENQGFLGPILEFGGAHNAPRNDGQQALDTEAPRFEKAIADLAGKHLT